MAAKAIIVHNEKNEPVTEYEAFIAGARSFCYSNPDGYLLYSDLPAGQTYVRIIANGYLPELFPLVLDAENQEIRFGVEGGATNCIHFPSLLSAIKSFPKPSRDSIINVKANLCNLYDAAGIPIFEPFIDSLIVDDVERAEDWIVRLKQAGSTHITLKLSGDYPQPLGWIERYPISGYDWMNDIRGFSKILDWVQARGLVPIVKLAADGQDYSAEGWTYGWSWGMANLPRILEQLKPYWTSCLWSTGFDGCFPNWTPEQTIQFLRMLRAVLGEQGNIDTEFAGPGSISYCHLGNGAADWSENALGILDCFSVELQTNPAEADGIAQTATRLLGPAAKNCPETPWYLAGLSKKINICFYETMAYWFIHKQDDDYKTAANLGANYGFTSFGNGLPG